MTELAVRPPVVPGRADEVTVINPDTGEALDLASASVGDLAAWRDAVKAWELSAKLAKQLVDTEVIRRMDARNEHTMYEDGFQITAPASTDKTEYDGYELHDALLVLASDPSVNLEAGAVTAAFDIFTVCKPKANKLQALAKRPGPVADAVAAHSRRVPVDRRVSVKPR